MLNLIKRLFCKCLYRRIIIDLKSKELQERYLLRSICLNCGKEAYKARMTIKQIQNFLGDYIK